MADGAAPEDVVSPDLIFSIGGLIFVISLLPAVFNKKTAMPLKTSLSTGLVLAAYLYAYAQLHLWLSLAVGACTASEWLFIAARRRVPS